MRSLTRCSAPWKAPVAALAACLGVTLTGCLPLANPYASQTAALAGLQMQQQLRLNEEELEAAEEKLDALEDERDQLEERLEELEEAREQETASADTGTGDAKEDLEEGAPSEDSPGGDEGEATDQKAVGRARAFGSLQVARALRESLVGRKKVLKQCLTKTRREISTQSDELTLASLRGRERQLLRGLDTLRTLEDTMNGRQRDLERRASGYDAGSQPQDEKDGHQSGRREALRALDAELRSLRTQRVRCQAKLEDAEGSRKATLEGALGGLDEIEAALRTSRDEIPPSAQA